MQNFQCSFLSVMIDATLPKIHFLPVSPTFLQFFASSLTSVFIITLNFSLFGVLTIISCQLCYIWLTAFPPVYHIQQWLQWLQWGVTFSQVVWLIGCWLVSASHK
jgi:hypothetical protein